MTEIRTEGRSMEEIIADFNKYSDGKRHRIIQIFPHTNKKNNKTGSLVATTMGAFFLPNISENNTNFFGELNKGI